MTATAGYAWQKFIFSSNTTSAACFCLKSLQQVNAANADINCDLAFRTIHAKLGANEIIIGPEVFYEAYKRTDLRLVNYLFSIKLIRFIYAKFYGFFAKYRQQISKLIGLYLLRLVQKKYPSN